MVMAKAAAAGPAKRPVASPAVSKTGVPALSPPIKSPDTKKQRVGNEPEGEPPSPEGESASIMASPASPDSVGSTRKDLSPALEAAADSPKTPPRIEAQQEGLSKTPPRGKTHPDALCHIYILYMFCLFRNVLVEHNESFDLGIKQ